MLIKPVINGFPFTVFFFCIKKKKKCFSPALVCLFLICFFFSLPKGIFYLKNLFAIQDFISNLLQTINCLSSVLQTINNDFFVYVCV